MLYYNNTPLGFIFVVDFSTSYSWLVRQNHERWELWPGGGILHKARLFHPYLFIYDQTWGGSATFKRKWFVLLIRLFTYSYSDLTLALPTAFSSQCWGFMVCWLTDTHLLHYLKNLIALQQSFCGYQMNVVSICFYIPIYKIQKPCCY